MAGLDQAEPETALGLIESGHKYAFRPSKQLNPISLLQTKQVDGIEPVASYPQSPTADPMGRRVRIL